MPLSVLESIQHDLVDYKGRGLSVLEMSHRSADFIEIAEKAQADLRKLLAVPEHYSVLFMQGGASAQFALTVSNLDSENCVAFANTGYWSAKAISTATKTTSVMQVAGLCGAPMATEANSQESSGISVTRLDEWGSAEDASYLHTTDNETIDGISLGELPESPAPIVSDMSSSILSRPIDVKKYGLIYAGAQKNIGPAGIFLISVMSGRFSPSHPWL